MRCLTQNGRLLDPFKNVHIFSGFEQFFVLSIWVHFQDEFEFRKFHKCRKQCLLHLVAHFPRIRNAAEGHENNAIGILVEDGFGPLKSNIIFGFIFSKFFQEQNLAFIRFQAVSNQFIFSDFRIKILILLSYLMHLLKFLLFNLKIQ